VLKSCIPEGVLEEDDEAMGDALPQATKPLPLPPDHNDQPHCADGNADKVPMIVQAGGGMDSTAPCDAHEEASSTVERGMSLGSPKMDNHLPIGAVGPHDIYEELSSIDGGVRLEPPHNTL
jgi:hypothetical protein